PSTGKKTGTDTVDAAVVAELKAQLAAAQAEASKPHRQRLPAERTAITHKFEIAGHEGYITVGLYEDGRPGEIFLKMAKEGSTVSGLMDSFATTVSVALQYGVPLRDLVNKFAHVRFEPSGFTGNQEIPIAKSLVDYIFRWLGSRFLTEDDKAMLGLQPATVADSSTSFPGGFGAQSPSLSDPGAAAADRPPFAFSAARGHAEHRGCPGHHDVDWNCARDAWSMASAGATNRPFDIASYRYAPLADSAGAGCPFRGEA